MLNVVNTGLTNTFINALAINASGYIFAGAYEGGVFRSLDNVDSWTAVNFGLIGTFIQAFAVNSSGHIFVGTQGGGVFRSIQSITAVRSRKIEMDMSSAFALSQNYPNPSTQISFVLSSAQKLALKIFDLADHEVATLLQNKRRPVGVHEVNFDAKHLSVGCISTV